MCFSFPADQPPQPIERRRALALLSLGGLAVAQGCSAAVGNEPPRSDTPGGATSGGATSGGATSGGGSSGSEAQTIVRHYATVAELSQDATLQVNTLARTLGFYSAGDGGEATYVIDTALPERPADGGATIALLNGLTAK